MLNVQHSFNIEHSALSIEHDPLCGGPGIGRGDDWPADDDVAGARGDRFAGAHRPLLVVISSPAAADPWRHDRKISPASLPDRRGLLRRCHDPIESRRLRELRRAGVTAADVIGRAAAAVGLIDAPRAVSATGVADLFR